MNAKVQSKMKIIIRIIMFLLLILECPSVIADANIQADIAGSPIITDNLITANINLTYLQIGFSRLFANTLDEYIINNNNPQIKIPVTNLYLLCDGQAFQLSNTGMQLFYIDMLDFTRTAQKNITLRLENTGELPAGTYSVPIRFVNRTNIALEYECEFLFSFTIDEKQSISSFSGEPNIILSEDDVFNKQVSIKNKNDIRLDITSNTDWKLWLDTSNIKELEGEYSFLIKNAAGSITNYEQNYVRLLPNQHYLLARGTSTIEGLQPGNNVPSNIVTVYSFKNSGSELYR